MSSSQKPDLFGVIITSLLGGSDKLLDNIGKGVSDIMAQAQAQATKPAPGDTFEDDLETAVGDDDLFEISYLEAARVQSSTMADNLSLCVREIVLLEADGYEISSVNTSWEKDDSDEWVVVSYITYS